MRRLRYEKEKVPIDKELNNLLDDIPIHEHTELNIEMVLQAHLYGLRIFGAIDINLINIYHI